MTTLTDREAKILKDVQYTDYVWGNKKYEEREQNGRASAETIKKENEANKALSDLVFTSRPEDFDKAEKWLQSFDGAQEWIGSS